MERSIAMANGSRIRVQITCAGKNIYTYIYKGGERDRRKVHVEPLVREDACRAGSAVGVGLVCKAYPAGVKAEGKRGGKLSGSLPAATSRYGLLGALVEPPTPGLGRRFWGPCGRRKLASPGPCNLPLFPGPGKAAGLRGLPAPFPKNLSQLGACTQGLACLSRRVYRCVCGCGCGWMGGWERPLCMCGSAGLPCPRLLSVWRHLEVLSLVSTGPAGKAEGVSMSPWL